MSGWKLNPHVSRSGNLRIRLFWGLELEPTNGVPGTSVFAFFSNGGVEWEIGWDGRNCDAAYDGRVDFGSFALGDVVHIRKYCLRHGANNLGL